MTAADHLHRWERIDPVLFLLDALDVRPEVGDDLAARVAHLRAARCPEGMVSDFVWAVLGGMLADGVAVARNCTALTGPRTGATPAHGPEKRVDDPAACTGLPGAPRALAAETA